MAIVIVQAKSTQKWYFLVSKPILKKFPLPMQKNWVKMVPKQMSMSIPEAPSCRVKEFYFENPITYSGLQVQNINVLCLSHQTNTKMPSILYCRVN